MIRLFLGSILVLTILCFSMGSNNTQISEGFSAKSYSRDKTNYGLYQNNSFFHYPYVIPYYFRNYGELLDPYFPQYYRSYWWDVPYYLSYG